MKNEKNDLGAVSATEGVAAPCSVPAPKLSHAAPTPGPWRWEVNLKSKAIQLCGGRPRFDLTVMDFVRWGMGGAAPRFLRPMNGSTLMLMEQATRWAEVVPGREHHSEWFRTLNHPDAQLITAAPDYHAAVAEALRPNDGYNCEYVSIPVKAWRMILDAHAKAEGR